MKDDLLGGDHTGEMRNRKKSLTHLILDAKSGNPEDLEELYERFKPMIRKMARRFDWNDWEDAKQELMIELFMAVQRFEPHTHWGVDEVERYRKKRSIKEDSDQNPS